MASALVATLIDLLLRLLPYELQLLLITKRLRLSLENNSHSQTIRAAGVTQHMHTIIESDWKLLRKLHAEALQRFCQRTLVEVKRITSDDSCSYHERYLAMYGLIRQENKDMAYVFDDLSRSKAILRLIAIKSRHLITPEEFSAFSDETKNIVNSFSK